MLASFPSSLLTASNNAGGGLGLRLHTLKCVNTFKISSSRPGTLSPKQPSSPPPPPLKIIDTLNIVCTSTPPSQTRGKLAIFWHLSVESGGKITSEYIVCNEKGVDICVGSLIQFKLRTKRPEMEARITISSSSYLQVETAQPARELIQE